MDFLPTRRVTRSNYGDHLSDGQPCADAHGGHSARHQSNHEKDKLLLIRKYRRYLSVLPIADRCWSHETGDPARRFASTASIQECDKVTRIGINGFGRMGRLVLRAGWGRPDLEFVHINELAGGSETAAHLLTFDSVHGRWDRGIEGRDGELSIDGTPIGFSAKAKPG
jgi:hypothetical protein